MREVIGSPGASESAAKAIAVMPMSTGTLMSKRRTM